MTVDQVEQFLGDRAFDRLQERLVIIRCDWESHRQQNRVVMELWSWTITHYAST